MSEEGSFKNFKHHRDEVWQAAINMCGSRSAAEEWLYQEAIALDKQRPVDVMEKDPQKILTLIYQLEHGVYL